MAHAKREAIVSALKATNYNLSSAAVRLEVGRSTLYRLLEKYEIELEVDPTAQNEFLEEVVAFSIATTSGKSGSDPANRRPTRLEIRGGKLVLIGIRD
ncbi:helix-turn-helix domain-containing protein [Sphingomonas sp. LB3N6]|uniref:helix-turn-helix domain-containing protein n=1 Tax=Sphingomonas fucosidasi TaxID=3096164 RepID=UPI002FC74285